MRKPSAAGVLGSGRVIPEIVAERSERLQSGV
jgi:hypothetical protein